MMKIWVSSTRSILSSTEDTCYLDAVTPKWIRRLPKLQYSYRMMGANARSLNPRRLSRLSRPGFTPAAARRLWELQVEG